MNRCVIGCEANRAVKVARDCIFGTERVIRFGLELEVHHRRKGTMMIGKYGESVIQVPAYIARGARFQRLDFAREVIIFDNFNVRSICDSVVEWAKTGCKGAT